MTDDLPSWKMSPRQRRMRYMGRRLLSGLVLAVLAGGIIIADRSGLASRPKSSDFEKYHNKQARVINVVDGDTLDIDIPDADRRRTRIRLWGVDTPETVKPNTPPQHFGAEASTFTKKLALNQTVKIMLETDRDNRDKYHRLLAYVYLPDGRMLNRLLVEEGYAYADPRFPHQYKKEFQRLQNRAKNGRMGLWKDVKQSDLPYYYQDNLKLPR